MAHAPPPLATLEQIVSPPSTADGIPSQVEADLRVAGCMLIQEAGIMLKLPQTTMATAQVVFHRFFYVSSMYSYGVNDISVACLFLASKLCETPIRLRDLINTYLFLTARIQHLLSLPPSVPLRASPLRPSNGDGTSNLERKEKEEDPVWAGFVFDVPSHEDQVFWDWKDTIVTMEMQLLKRLGFNMQVDLPYNHMINYLKILDLVFVDEIAQMCWSILNDMLLTPLYAVHPPHTLACASILITSRLRHVPLPPQWYLLFDVTYDDIWPACGAVMTLWNDWGMDYPRGAVKREESGVSEEDKEEERKGKETRWRRAWVLAQGRKAVRRWVEERKKEGDA
ncbi:hypothetical protein IAT38_004128 [Cryptococcus sp. DSM 104549]